MTKIKLFKDRNAGNVFKNIAIGLFTLLWVSPFLWMVIISIRVPSEALTLTFPTRFTLANFADAFEKTNALISFKNSFIVATCATLLTLGIASLAGYGFSRYEIKGKEFLLSLLLVLRSFPVIIIAIAFFMIVAKLGLYNTHISLIILNSVVSLPMAIWNMMTIFDGLPSDLEEASLVDGANRLQSFWKISLPLAIPGLAATGAFLFLITWNEFLFAQTFISSNEKKLITVAIVENTSQFGVNIIGMVATSVLAAIPICVIFVIIQPYIISGLYGTIKSK